MENNTAIRHTVITTNNGYDSILLVDGNDLVISAWQADADTMKEYAVSKGKADEWHENEWSTFEDPAMSGNEEILRTIEAYGNEVGRDGEMSAERREFWFRNEVTTATPISREKLSLHLEQRLHIFDEHAEATMNKAYELAPDFAAVTGCLLAAENESAQKHGWNDEYNAELAFHACESIATLICGGVH